MFKKIVFISLVCMSFQSVHAADNESVILELGLSSSKSPWFVDGERGAEKNTSLPGVTAAAAFALPLANKDNVVIDIQSEFHSGKKNMNPTEEFGPTTVGLLSTRYEKHFSNVLVAPFVGLGKANQKDGGAIGHAFGLQAMSKLPNSRLNFFGTVGKASFTSDTTGSGTSDGAFVGTFTELGAISSFTERLAVKVTLGHGSTDKSKDETNGDGVFSKGSYRSLGIKGIYQPESFKNTAITFGIEQQRHKLVDDNSERLSLNNTRVFAGLVISFGGKVSSYEKLRPLAPSLDPLRASVYGEVADTISYP